jgi:hypothetical protein
MDDPLVPKSVSGGTRLLVQIICALAVIFIFVAILLIFIEGGKTGSGGWVVVGTGFILTTSTTGVLVRWVMKNELEESKHFYLLVSQALSLVVLSAGFLAVIYAGESPLFYIGGAVGPVIMEQGAQPRGGPLQLMLNNNQSNVLTIGQTPCQSFVFPTKVAKDEKYSVTLKAQASGSFCQVLNGNGIGSKNLLGNDGIRLQCQAAWIIGGVVLFSGGGQWPPGLILANNQQEQIQLQSGSGSWFFPTPVPNQSQYSVTIFQQPPSLTCQTDKPVGIATAPVIDIQVKCTSNPTPAPPTKSD